ncbi:hypothetical protein D3C86_1952000 [compost metagenome]
MCYHHDTGAFFVLFVNNVHEESTIDWVKSFGRLVENEQFGIIHNCDAELDFLLLSTR